MNGGPHILYRCFNADRELLYIGITNDLDNRLRQHSQTAPWWKEFDSCSQDDCFDDRWVLERAERAAIIAEEPLYNVSYSMGARAMQLESERSKIWSGVVEELVNASVGPPIEYNPPTSAVDADSAEAAEPSEWLTRTQLADRLRLPKQTLALWASKGSGPRFAKFGRHVRYRMTDVELWEEQQIGGAA